ncbi:MAG: ABC transporter permease [Planctomycetota bacterium]
MASLIAAWIPLAPVLAPLVRFDRLADMLDSRTALLLWRSIWMSTAAAVCAILLGWPYAVMACRLKFPGAGIFRLLMPLPLLLPPLMVAQAWFGLTGMTGAWASVFTFGVCYAPLPALLASRSLRQQSAAAHDAALLVGPRFALGEMLRISFLPALIGGIFAFLFASADFAVPDYFATVGDLFHVYAAEIFGHSRNSDFTAGATASLPLVLVGLLLLLFCARLQRRQMLFETGHGRTPTTLDLGRQRFLLLGFSLILLTVLLLAPLARVLFETGMQGPLSERSWGEVSSQAFHDALTRGRGDVLRTLSYSGLAGLMCLVLAPLWAHMLLHARSAWRLLLLVFVTLPLLVPSVALGFGSILMFNQPWLEQFYTSIWLPALLVAGRFLPIAVWILVERMGRVPAAQEEAAALAGSSYLRRLFRYRLGPVRGALWLAVGLVIAFGVRELDFAILLPAANQSAAVRYYNALHFSRDNFVAAYGLVLAAILFLPVMLSAWLRNLKSSHA